MARHKELKLPELDPVEIARVVVEIPYRELETLRLDATADGFNNVADWLAWLARARSKGMLSYLYDE